MSLQPPEPGDRKASIRTKLQARAPETSGGSTGGASGAQAPYCRRRHGAPPKFFGHGRKDRGGLEVCWRLKTTRDAAGLAAWANSFPLAPKPKKPSRPKLAFFFTDLFSPLSRSFSACALCPCPPLSSSAQRSRPSSGGSTGGASGAQAPLLPKKPWSPPSPPSILNFLARGGRIGGVWRSAGG